MNDVSPQLQDAIAHHQANRLSEAAEGYRVILADDPDHADALHLLGLISFQQGQLDEALGGIDQAIAIDGEVAMYHANRGRILKAVGKNEAAAEAFGRALRLVPGHPGALSDLSGAQVDAGNPEAGLHFAIRATELAPDMAAAHYNMGLALMALKEWRPARAAFEHAIDLDPELAAGHYELGRICHEEMNLEAAERHYLDALEIDPAMIEAMTNLGNVLRASYRLEEAVECYQKALEGGRDIAAIHTNLGVALQEQGDFDGALEAYDAALAHDPDDAETHRNRAQALLQLGRFDEGWSEFEWRWQTKHFAAIRRNWKKPQWQGAPLGEGTLLVHAEQGFGDCIQFARYLPMAAERVQRLVVECPAPLAGLMSRIDGVDDVIAAGGPLPCYQSQIPMMSLPGVFDTNLDNMPAGVPYLSIAEATASKWSMRTGRCDGLKVGVVWKGSHNHQRNKWRSPGLKAMRSLIGVPGVSLVSLQKDDETIDLKAAHAFDQMIRLGQEFRNFTDTAAAIQNLDLVIAPDTAVAHLAGALGRPVWLMLPHVSEWRWMTERNDSPWYPSMRIFRQTSRGDWKDVIEAMREDLANWAAN